MMGMGMGMASTVVVAWMSSTSTSTVFRGVCVVQPSCCPCFGWLLRLLCCCPCVWLVVFRSLVSPSPDMYLIICLYMYLTCTLLLLWLAWWPNLFFTFVFSFPPLAELDCFTTLPVLYLFLQPYPYLTFTSNLTCIVPFRHAGRGGLSALGGQLPVPRAARPRR